jgi:hypothetical protein
LLFAASFPARTQSLVVIDGAARSAGPRTIPTASCRRPRTCCPRSSGSRGGPGRLRLP